MLARLTLLRFSFVTAALLAASAVGSVANANNPSGMLLGVYAFENWQGLRVTGTIPGYSAHGRLFPNDVLLQATTDGVDVYCIKTMDEIECAKDQIGPNMPAAIEFFRPGVGLMYAWVEFQPIGGGVMAYSQEGIAMMAQPKFKAKFFLESEKPGAKLMFQGGKIGLPGPKPMPKPMPLPQPNPPVVKPFPFPKPDFDIKFPKPQVDPKPMPKPGPVIKFPKPQVDPKPGPGIDLPKFPIKNAKINPGDLFKN
jgi:hypothetical protein